MSDISLEHAGVKGMRWGFRKAPASATKEQLARQKREVRISRGIALGVLGVGLGLKVAPIALPILAEGARSASAKVGERYVNSIVRGLNAQPVSALRQGADGIWRLIDN